MLCSTFISPRQATYVILASMKQKRTLPLFTWLILGLLLLACEPKRKIYVAPTPPPAAAPAEKPPLPAVEPPPSPPVVWTAESALVRAAAPPQLRDDQPAQSLLDAIDLSLERFVAVDPQALVRFGAEQVTVGRLVEGMRDFRDRLAEMGLSEAFIDYLRRNFDFYCSAAPKVVFTGYYEPLLRGSLRPSPAYPYPLYGRPADLVTVDLPQFYFFKEQNGFPQIKGRVEGNRLVPYYTREEIDAKGALSGRGLEIVWIDSLVDVFFLHIQGSGVVELEDGRRLFVGYADQNGHPFRSIGRWLLDRGLVGPGQLSLQEMKAFLNPRPAQATEAMNANPSYIFFKVNEQSATGTFGARLTPWRSIASDPRLFPLGALAWIESEKPLIDGARKIGGWQKFGRFVLNQDTGGAIRGADRVDLFTGQGELSELVAGGMKQEGMLYFLLKKPQRQLGTIQ